jgi:phenylacetate-CoA ligase
MTDCFNIPVETIKPGRLRIMVRQKLARQLNYLYHHSPFCRNIFDERGLRPDQIKDEGDLARLPFTTKDELRKSQERYPPLGDYMAAAWEQVIRIHASSGTTGLPSYVGITAADKRTWVEMAARCAYARGVRRESIVVHGYALSFFVGGLPVKDGIEEIGATFVPLGTGASYQLISAVRRLKADVLSGTPSYMLYLADYIREEFKLEPAELGLRKLIGGGEPGIGIPAIRQRLEESFNAQAYEAMGNTDLGPVIFAECPQKSGMHFLAPDFILAEIIDHQGQPVKMEDGTEGELVCTSLDRECSPVLRFRSGDLVKVWTSPCPCGRTGFRVRCLGRVDDMLLVRGVNLFPSAIQEVVSQFRQETSGIIQICLPRPGPRVDPPVKIRVECCLESGQWPDFKARLEQTLREKLLFRADLLLVAPGTLPRNQKKTQLVKISTKKAQGEKPYLGKTL